MGLLLINMLLKGGYDMMHTFDLTPLYRTSIGFDRLAQMLDTINVDVPTGYPPYNIEKLEDNKYGITMAVSGFDESDLNIDVKENILSVKEIFPGMTKRSIYIKGLRLETLKEVLDLPIMLKLSPQTYQTVYLTSYLYGNYRRQ